MRARSQRIIGSARPRCFGSMEQEQDFPYGREAPSEKRIRKADAETDADAEGRNKKQTLPSMSLWSRHSRAIRDFRRQF